MKKLICMAVVTVSMFAMAEEPVKPTPVAPTVAESVTKGAQGRTRAVWTPERRAKMREQIEKRRAERMAKMEAKMLEIIKKYIPDEAKAKALAKELSDMRMSGYRSMMPRRPKMPNVQPKAPTAK